MGVDRSEIGDAHPVGRTALQALALMVGGPAVFLGILTVRYSLVGPACEISVARVLLEASTLLALAAALASLVLGWRALSITSIEDLVHQQDQARFVAVFGLMTGALFVLSALALWLPSLFLSPCGRP